jgi:uncharacterized protein YndB with AHSA1/START domain
MGVERGTLVLADISGYTGYLTGVELEHSHDVIADLLQLIVETGAGVLTLSELEGDCVFSYRADEDARAVLPLIEACYVAFRRRVRTIAQQTTCTCNACRRIPDLDLKVFAHFGEFVRRETAGRANLVGPDVILAHRLLKNRVVERTGLRAYALLTDPFVERCGLDLVSLDLREHVERYDDIGQVRGRLIDLDERWRAAESGRLVYVSDEEAIRSFAWDVPAPVAIVWAFLTEPDKRVLWTSGMKRIDEDTASGLPGIGTRNHCVHGRSAIREEVLDWKPFEYYSLSTRDAMGTVVFTVELSEPEPERTHLAWRATPRDLRSRVMLKVVWSQFRRHMERGMTTMTEHILSSLRDPADRRSTPTR